MAAVQLHLNNKNNQLKDVNEAAWTKNAATSQTPFPLAETEVSLMQEVDKYSNYVIKAILSAKGQDFSEVAQLNCISSSLFDTEQYSALLNALKAGQTENLPKDILQTESTFREYIYVYSFVDQNRRKWLATIYDCDELWQDPEVIDLLPFQ